MKRLIFLLMTALFCGCLSAQCPQGNITLTTQQEVDNFAANYPNCTELLGNLSIDDDYTSSITSLAGLSQITAVGGDVDIIYNDNLTNLTGLNNLTSIGGYLNIDGNDGLTNLTGLDNLNSISRYLSIDDNDGLTNLAGLDNLTHIGGFLEMQWNDNLMDVSALDNVASSTLIGLKIWQNPKLTALPDFNNLTAIIGRVWIAGNDNLTDFMGLDNVTTIGGFLELDYNDNITDMTGLNSLTSIGEHMHIHDNDNLVDFSGMNNLTTIGGDVEIGGNNSSLTSLNGLNNLMSINGHLHIKYNPIISDISALENVDMSNVTDIDIYGNSNLSFCGITSICDYLEAGGTYYFSNNATGCNSYEVYASCDVQPSCDDETVTFTSQAQIDNFSSNNPNCTEIAGNVHIYSSAVNSDITNLDGLSQITSISGNLIITSNTNLSTIMGLSNLTTLGGYLYMLGNSTLTSLAGLENLDFTPISDVTIRDNDALSICGLEGLCAYLENNGSATIFNNGPGCDSPAEVLLFCNPPDDIDMDFGTNGTVDIAGHDVTCMLAQPDDKLVIFGSSVLRLNPDGTLDTSFGASGVASIGGFEGVLQPDGKIVVLAADQLARLNADGTLDATFGTGGTRPLIAPAKDIALSLDGKIVTSDTELVRYNADGSVDTAFGSNGIVSIEVQAYHYGEYPGAPQVLKTYYPSSHVVVKSDGKIVVAGDFAYQSRYNPEYIIYYNQRRCLLGYNADGTKDSNFNEWIEGWYQGDVFSYVGDLLLLPDDEFVMLSSNDFELEGNLCMNQYDANGAFIDSNCTYTSLCGDSYYYGALWSKATVADCGIFAFGEYGTIFGNTCKFLTRTDYDGTPFSGFGDNGGVALPVVAGTETADIALQSDGGIIVAGNSATGIVLARLSNDEACNPLFLLTEPPSPPSDPCGGTPATTDSLTHIFDEDLFIDGVGFANNPTVTFTDPATPADAVLSDISLELYFRLNGNSCENEIALQITDPAGNTQPLTAYTTCDGGNGLYYVNLNVPSGNTTGSTADWLVEFDDTNDQNSGYEYSVRFARLNYVATTGGGGETIVNEVSDFADSDLFIDGVGFANNGTYTFTDPGTPANAVLSDISLELYFRLNGASCENEIALQITDPAGNTQPLTAYTTCDGGTGLFYVNLDVPSGNTTGSVADWVVQFDDTNDQNAGYEYSVRFGRLTYTTTYTEGGGGMAVTVNDEVSDFADYDLFIDGVGFANNGTYTFTDPGTPADAILSNISLELYFRLNGNSCENEIAIQVTDPAGNTQPLTAYTTCDGGNGLYYVNLDVPSGNTTGSMADWLVEFDDTNDQNSDYEYSIRFGRLTYDVEYTECVPMLVNEENTSAHQYINTSAQENVNSSTRQLNNSSLKLYPVPANHHLNVEYFSENTHPMNIEILSNEGKTLVSSQENLQEGMNTIQLDIADLPAGHYHIRMYNADDMQMQSFVKITP